MTISSAELAAVFAAERFLSGIERFVTNRAEMGAEWPPQKSSTEMANTSSARKATRKIARRTEINKGRRSKMRNYVRKVEEAITAGDRALALTALKEAEPIIMRSAQQGVVHANAASRKVSRLNHRVSKLAH